MSASLPLRPAVDNERRLWLTASAAMGGVGIAATAVPFAASFAPSERARALGAAAAVDLQGFEPGELLTVEWRGQPVFVLRRTPQMLESLAQNDEMLADPDSRRSDQPEYATNADRSAKPEIAVLVGICTHLGCIPTFRPTPGAPDIGAAWPGGFYCPCHGSKFHLAGRVFRNVPAPTNLAVPPYRFASAASLLIGAGPKT